MNLFDFPNTIDLCRTFHAKDSQDKHLPVGRREEIEKYLRFRYDRRFDRLYATRLKFPEGRVEESVVRGIRPRPTFPFPEDRGYRAIHSLSILIIGRIIY